MTRLRPLTGRAVAAPAPTAGERRARRAARCEDGGMAASSTPNITAARLRLTASQRERLDRVDAPE